MTKELYNKINDLNLKVGDIVEQLPNGLSFGEDPIVKIINIEIHDADENLIIRHLHIKNKTYGTVGADKNNLMSVKFKRINETQYQKLKRIKNIE